MNKHTGKLLILGGFGIMTLTSLLSALIFFTRILLPNIFVALFGLANVIAWLAVVLGFGVLFLANRNVLDLCLTIGFAATAFFRFISVGLGSSELLHVINGMVFTGSGGLASLILTVTFIIWAVKLFKTTPLGSILVIASVILPFFVTRLIFVIFGLSYFTTAIALIAEIALISFRPIAAYLDM